MMLSNEDIEKACRDWEQNPKNEGLEIKDFNQDCLTSVGYDLRVGEEGFSWKSKKVIKIKEDGIIKIDAYDTVIIKTLESVSLSKKISGTVHSMVSQVIVQGLSHISTTVDPDWSGKLLILVHNYYETSTELSFGDRFCTICFYKLETPATGTLRRDVDRDEIWQQLKKEARQEAKNLQNKRNKRIIILIIYVVVFLGSGLYLSVKNPEIATSVATVFSVISPLFLFLFSKFINQE